MAKVITLQEIKEYKQQLVPIMDLLITKITESIVSGFNYAIMDAVHIIDDLIQNYGNHYLEVKIDYIKICCDIDFPDKYKVDSVNFSRIQNTVTDTASSNAEEIINKAGWHVSVRNSGYRGYIKITVYSLPKE